MQPLPSPRVEEEEIDGVLEQMLSRRTLSGAVRRQFQLIPAENYTVRHGVNVLVRESYQR